MIVGRLGCSSRTKPTPEIRAPDDIVGVIVEAAQRLLRSRLRQHLLARATAIERSVDRADRVRIYEMVADAEKSMEASAMASWAATLGLWTRRHDDDPAVRLRACVMLALGEAVEMSASFLEEVESRYAPEEVGGWLREFVAAVDFDTPLVEIPPPPV